MGNLAKLLTALIVSCAMHLLVAQQSEDENGHSEMSHQHMHHKMDMDRDGMVMHANDSIVPKDCERISEDFEFEIKVGREYAEVGYTFGYDQHEFRVPGCSRIQVTLTNKDDVRHQWMVHGLPRYLYPLGMFHLEVNGRRTRAGTFIVPSDDRTYLIHCDMTQHMEKGLKAQLIVGGSKTDLPSIPGISGSNERDNY